MLNVRQVTLFTLVLLLAAWSDDIVADPPQHAPAHGWRDKHDPLYIGYTGRYWDHDYGILSGHCDRETVATVLGGIAGGVIGSRLGNDDNRTVATVVGALTGALIGKQIGREMDDADRACAGHALEVGEPGKVITWTNRGAGVEYQMLLKTSGDKSNCREYALLSIAGDKKSFRQGVACQRGPGIWTIGGTLKT